MYVYWFAVNKILSVQVSHINFSMVRAGSKSEKEVELSVNKEAVLEDFRVMGEGLVARVELVAKA